MALMLMISGFCLTGFIVYELGYRLKFTHSVLYDSRYFSPVSLDLLQPEKLFFHLC